MDTGDTGHSAWFQSRVQVLVRSLRSHQGGFSSPQLGDRLEEVGEPSVSSPSRRSLHLGRSLASRWQEYSPGPLRRLKKLFSAPSERDHSDDWDSEGDDVKKERPGSADVGRDCLESFPLLPGGSPSATVSQDVTGSEALREPQEDINRSLEEVHQKSFREDLFISDHPVICSQNLKNESGIHSPDIVSHTLRDPCYNKADDIHSKTSVPVTEDLHIPQNYGSNHPASFVPGNSDAGGETSDVECGRCILQQPHEFNKRFYVLTASSEDGDYEDRDWWQKDAMTQWRHADSDACTGKGRATVIQEDSGGSAVAAKEFAVCQGPPGAVDICLSAEEGTMATFDEEVEVLLKTSSEAQKMDAVPEASSCDVSCDMALNVEEEDIPCDRIAEAIARRVAVEEESSVDVSKPGIDTHIIVCDVDESDRPPLPFPNIILDVSDPPTSSEAASSHSQELHRTPKLQLQIATTSSQSAARKSPVTVQEWVDSLPLPNRSEEGGGEFQPTEETYDHLGLGLGAEARLLYGVLPAVTVVSPAESHPASVSVGKVTSAAHLAREPSVQSDVTSHTGSHCSSVESYLESRRPDPEEILLGLGFGRSAGGSGGVDTEFSRIPRRFLQPSKVRGVAIDDFLRYQQDLIETFESGFCGYRGLTGSSHTPPSVIVAKIMEKLREHERENIPPGSVVSAPATGNSIPPPPSLPATSNKFSRAARRVLTRTTVLGALPCNARQQQQQSVLTPDNRRFLDNQGSKSPEVPRKRMIIGHRSYTFGCDGDLIELDPVSATSPTPNISPKPKPLLHKDSVLSTATSLSFTSVDSDSDTDDRGNDFGIQPRHQVFIDHPTASTPRSTYFSSLNSSQDPVSEKVVTQKVYPLYPVVSKRMSSTSLSSWESEAVLSPINSSSDIYLGVRHQCTQELVAKQPSEEEKDGGLSTVTKHFSNVHSSPDIPLSVYWPMRYESIDEDVEIKSDKSASLLSASASGESQDTPRKANVDRQVRRYDKMETVDIVDHVDHKSGNGMGNAEDCDMNNFSGPTGVQRSAKTLEEQLQIQKEVISLLQVRRGSLKRQKRILDDEEPLEVSDKDSSELMKNLEITSDVPHEETRASTLDSGAVKSIQDVKENTEKEYDSDETATLRNLRNRELESRKDHCVGNADAEHPMQKSQKMKDVHEQNSDLPLDVEELCSNLNVVKEKTKSEVQLKYAESIDTDLLQVSGVDNRGDSFEMEEICTFGEEEGRMTVLSRAWSDSSGFLDGDSEIYLSRQNGHNTDATITNLESSQRDGSGRTSSKGTQMPSVASELISRGDLELTDVSFHASSDIVKSELVVRTNLSDEKSETVKCPTDFSLTSSNEKCLRRREIGSSAINQQNLPNNLFQELSSANDWLCKCNVPCVMEHVSDLSGSCAVLHERQRSLANVSFRGVRESVEATAYSFSDSNKSAINPGVQNFTSVSQDSSLIRTLLCCHIPRHRQPSISTNDDSELAHHRTMSLHSVDHKNGLRFGGVRRVKSAPHRLERLASSDDMMRSSSWSSVSNMFSFCSDESVIHVGLQRSGLGRANEKRLSDVCAGGLYRPEVMEQRESRLRDVDASDNKHPIDSIGATQYLKPCSVPCGRNTRKSSSDGASASRHSVTGLRELVGELAERGWDISMGTDSSHFACHTDQQLLRLQGDALRAGLAAYGRQLVGGQASEHNGNHEVAEASKELQAVWEVRDRIAAELRRVADLLEEQPPHRAASITGQMAALLREQTRLCHQLEALSCESSPSILVEPPPCCSVLDAVREENRRLQNMVEKNSEELKEIRKLLKELVAVKNSQS